MDVDYTLLEDKKSKQKKGTVMRPLIINHFILLTLNSGCPLPSSPVLAL